MTDESKAPSEMTPLDASLRPNLESPAMPGVQTIEFGSPQLQAIRDPGIDVLLLVATTVELRAACSALSPLDGEAVLLCFYRDDVAYYVGRLGAAFTVAVMSRMAADSSGGSLVVAKNAIALTRPAAVIAVGIAFGADPAKQRIGDVLVASQLINYELQRIQPGGSIPRGSRPETGQLLGNLFRDVTDWKFLNIEGGDCRVEFGPLLSGAKLIDDIDFKSKLLRQYPDAIGGEMEGTGVYAAARDATISEWIIVKSICDWADGKKMKMYQAHSAGAAVSLIQRVLSNEQRVAALRAKRSSHLLQTGPSRISQPRGRLWFALLGGAILALVLGYHLLRERRRDAARHELAQARRLVQSGRPSAAISAFTAALPLLEAEDLAFNVAEARCERALLTRMGDPVGSEPEFRWVISEAVRLGTVELEAKANLGLAGVLLGFGQREEALQLAERARDLTTNSQDHLLRLNILVALGKVYTASRKFESAQLLLQSASEECAELPQAKDCLLYVGLSLAELEFENDELQPAARRARQILAAPQGSTPTTKAITGDTLRLLARIELVVGTTTAARDLARQALALSKLNDDTIGHGNAALALGNIELWTGQRELASSYYSEAYDEFIKSGNTGGLAAVARSRGDAYFELLDFERAKSEFNESLRVYRQLGDYRRQGDCLLGLGQVELALGDVDAARQHTSESLAAFTEAGSRYGMSIAKYRQGQVLLATGELDQARRCFEVLLSFAFETGSRQLSALARSSLGRLALAAGNPQGAIPIFETAIADFVRTGDRLGEADSRRGLGDALATLKRMNEAQKEYHRSIGISKSLGDAAGISCGEQRLGWQPCWAEP